MAGRPCRTISPGPVTAATGTRGLERIWTLRDAGRSAALTGDGAKALSFFEDAWETSRNRDLPDIVMTAGLSADCAAPEFEVGHIERSLEFMQRALTEAAANVPFKAPYSADAFPGP
jgi:hypothetical protein